jgi:hypothetical protein
MELIAVSPTGIKSQMRTIPLLRRRGAASGRELSIVKNSQRIIFGQSSRQSVLKPVQGEDYVQ